MSRIDIKKEIIQRGGNCRELLKLLQQANLSSDDLAQAVDITDGWTPIHETMRSCEGGGILEIVEYLICLRPDCVHAKDAFGNLPLHVMPRFSPNRKESIQIDQLPARRFLWNKYPESLRKTNNRGETPLVKAILLDYNIFVAGIAGDNPELIKKSDDQGKLPLHNAVDGWNHKAVEMFLMVYPESIERLFMDDLPSGDVADRQRLLAAIAQAFPETFEVAYECTGEISTFENQISKGLIHQFFVETKLTDWGQELLWRLMKSALHRKKLALPEKVSNLESELKSIKTGMEIMEISLKENQNALEKKKDELSASKAELELAKEKIEQHQILAQEQEAKFLELAKKSHELQETRNVNSESKLFSKIDHEWSVPELKAILESLIQRLNYLIPEHTKPSMAQIAASFFVNDEEPSKERLLDTIEALNQELMEL
jgi:hypothetical protein